MKKLYMLVILLVTITYGNNNYEKYGCIAYSESSTGKIESRFAQANKGLYMPFIEINDLKAIIRLKDTDNRDAGNIKLVYSGTKKGENRLFDTYFVKETSGTTATLFIPKEDDKIQKNANGTYIMILKIEKDIMLGYNCIKYDNSISFNQYISSCKNGNSNDCYALALAYEKGGLGIKKTDKKKATYYYEKSCEYGNLDACSSVGIIHHNQNNNDLASKFLQKGCDGGDQYSCILIQKYGLVGLDMLNKIIGK